ITIAPFVCGAQSYLNKGVSVKAKQKPLGEVLDIIGKQGGFFFSYNSNIVPADSLIDIDVWNKTVKQTLDVIFKGRFEYKVTGSHVIIQYPSQGQYWYVSGYITDELTGQRVRDVSVFETNQLVACMTNDQGYFKLRLKERTPTTSIAVSKSLYRDTFVNVMPGVDQEVKVSISPKNIELNDVVISSKDNFVEGTWFGKFFLSSKQRMQSLNLNKFFVEMPVQGSIVPGLSSHGKMASQMINSLSFNLVGGYTAGVEGVEIGGIFNINKKDVKYVQMAGVLNMVGGDMKGVQVACIVNTVLDTAVGIQMAGIGNVVRKSVTGVQSAGIYNLAVGRVRGTQLAGILNTAIDSFTGLQGAGILNSSIQKYTGVQMAGVLNGAVQDVTGLQAAGIVNVCVKDVKGAQLAGNVNVCIGTMRGIQAASLVNYATRVKGVQLGLVNIADSSSGAAIGLFSFVLKGYHKYTIATNESMPYTMSVKTGTKWLHNVYTVGCNFDDRNKKYMIGMGFGSELPLSKRFTINPELTGHGIYLGSWEELNSMVRLQANVNVHFGKYVSLYAGPSFVMYWDNKQPKVDGFATEVLPAGYKKNNYSTGLSSWIGWQAGITVF
ncbi:MAG: hypothetical protein KDC07_07775, partial [Chitinophagaceae bacterium]|nr:hypothetical protein [Chitinophagaceae bacterium]